MTPRRAGLAAIWVAVIAAELGAIALMLSYDAPDNMLLDLFVAAAAVTAGVVALDQRPGNRIGWLMVAMAVAWVPPPYVVWDVPAITVPALLVNSLFFAFAGHLVLAYPSGRLQTRFERLLVVAIYVSYLWQQLAVMAVFSPRDWGCPQCDWQPALWPSESAYQTLETIGDLQTVIIAPLFVAAVALRFRRSSRLERHDLVPMWIGAVLLAVIEVLGIWGDDSWSGVWGVLLHVRYLLLALLPLVFLWGLLTARTAQSAIGALVLRLRDGVPPGRLAPLLAESLGDPSLQVYYASGTSGGWVSADRERCDDLSALEDRNHAVTVIENDGHPYAAMVHDRAVSDTLVRGVASAAAISMENERLHAELRAQLEEVRASRVRIVAAGDRERRRVERDLHDGAQQRLLALSMALRAVRRQLDVHDDGAALAALDAAESELRLGIRELRELARGIHPTILTDDGLDAAVRSLADRSTVPVHVEIALPERPSREAEGAAYFAISECLANVAKHSGASRAWVRADATEGRLVIEVRDDGCGGAVAADGGGLSGLADRVAAANGVLTVSSPAGVGTMVRIELPTAEVRA
jgi:signal transduction histidine kinase